MTDHTAAKQMTHQPRTLAVTGGKGGIGKTSISLNLALTLAREGHRVLLLDGDTDLANVSIMLGRYPQRTLANVMAGECNLEDALMEVQHGLHIIPGASGVQRCMEMDSEDSLPVLRALARLERHYDYVVTDTAAGLQPAGLHMIAAADMACVVLTPDPTSLTDAFSLIKVLHRRGYRRTPSILVNMAQGAAQAKTVYQRFAAAVARHLGIELHYLGAIWRDEALRQSVLNQSPVALMPASDPSSRQFMTLADMVKVRLSKVPARKNGIAAYWHNVSKKTARQAEEKEKRDKAAKDPLRECQRLASELAWWLDANKQSSMLRYEAFNELFALLGRNMDEDTVEIVQTGLASLDWEQLPRTQRRHMAAHLRQLADELDPPTSEEGGVGRAGNAGAEPEAVYDSVVFGEQEKLAQALRDQPTDVTLQRILSTMLGKDKSSS